MPVMIQRGQVQAHETGLMDWLAERAAERELDSSTAETCACEECQTPARDEMWTRWA